MEMEMDGSGVGDTPGQTQWPPLRPGLLLSGLRGSAMRYLYSTPASGAGAGEQQGGGGVAQCGTEEKISPALFLSGHQIRKDQERRFVSSVV